MDSRRTGILLLNVRAGKAAKKLEDAAVILAESGITIRKTVVSTKVPLLIAEASAAATHGEPLVIAAGGDGTFSSIARALMDSDTALGVLPLGTGNAFARDLGIPTELAEACEVVAKGRMTCVDVGLGNGRPFLNVATAGLTTWIAKSLWPPLKRRVGRWAYALAVAKAFQEVEPFRAVLETENGRVEMETLQLVIANGRYHAGPFQVAPDAGIATGRFSIYALESASRSMLIRLAMHLPKGDMSDLPYVHSEPALGGQLLTEPLVHVTFDGEIGSKTPLRFEVKPGALRVVVPQDFAG